MLSNRSVLVAALFAIAVGSSGCISKGVVKIPANLNIDPSAGPSQITLNVLGTPVTIPLHGGIQGEFDADLHNLLSPQGIVAGIKGNAITIAGDPVKIFGFKNGTLCVGQNPEDPTVGTALINLIKGSKADIHFGGLATSDLIANLTDSGTVALSVDADDVPIKIDLGKLLKLQIDGAIKVDVSVTGTIPDDVPLLAGSPFLLETHLTSAKNPSTDPLLADCQDFFNSL
jgi:hypothetical protein